MQPGPTPARVDFEDASAAAARDLRASAEEAAAQVSAGLAKGVLSSSPSKCGRSFTAVMVAYHWADCIHCSSNCSNAGTGGQGASTGRRGGDSLASLGDVSEEPCSSRDDHQGSGGHRWRHKDGTSRRKDSKSRHRSSKRSASPPVHPDARKSAAAGRELASPAWGPSHRLLSVASPSLTPRPAESAVGELGALPGASTGGQSRKATGRTLGALRGGPECNDPLPVQLLRVEALVRKCLQDGSKPPAALAMEALRLRALIRKRAVV